MQCECASSILNYGITQGLYLAKQIQTQSLEWNCQHKNDKGVNFFLRTIYSLLELRFNRKFRSFKHRGKGIMWSS